MRVTGVAPSLQPRIQRARRLLTADALRRPRAQRYTGLSQINPNGLPFQWSFCIGQPASLRFLCEIGPPGSNCETRHRRSVAALGEALTVLDIPTPDWLWDIALPQILPGLPAMPEGWRTSLWTALGASRDTVAVKVYASLEQGDAEERWRRIGRALLALDRVEALKTLCDISGAVSGTAIPVGIAFDVLPTGAPGRIKAYFQSGAINGNDLAAWYEAADLVRDLPALATLLRVFPCSAAPDFPPSAFFISAEFDRGNALTLKTDLTVSRWCASDADITAGLEQLCAALGLDLSLYQAAQAALGLWPPSRLDRPLLHVVGLGSERDGRRHINVYSEPH